MSRIFWFAAGAATSVYTMVKAKRTARHFTPDGLAARAAALGAGARMFVGEVSAGMAEREAELRDQLHLSTTSSTAPRLIETRTDEPESIADGHG
ncbi:MAG: DUF6167 family protein [Nocardioidaceae bacterium]